MKLHELTPAAGSTKEVKRKGVEVLGGKKSNAYADKDLRKRVYMDIPAATASGIPL